MWPVNRTLTSAFDAVFGFMAEWPSWLSLALLGGVTGVIALLAFRYTSNQDAIGRVRDGIKANLLAVKLFKDDVGVTLRAQGRMFVGAGKLLYLSLVPFLVMMVPMLLLLFQMGLRYEWRPLHAGETSLLVVDLKAGTPLDLSKVELETPEGVVVEAGPQRNYEAEAYDHPETNQLVWRLRVEAPGRHDLHIKVNDAAAEKTLVADTADGRIRQVLPVRAGQSWGDVFMFPAEQPAGGDDVIQRIALDHPPRVNSVFGFDIHWLVTYFILSIVIALVFKPVFKVKL